MNSSPNGWDSNTSLWRTPATNHCLATVVVALCLLGPGRTDAAGPLAPKPAVPEPVNSWVYQEINRQVLLGNLDLRERTTRPLARTLIAARVATAVDQGKDSPGLRRLAREFAWEMRELDPQAAGPETPPFWTIGPRESQVVFHWLLETTASLEGEAQPDWDASRFGATGQYWSGSSLALYGDYTVTGVDDAELYGNRVFDDFTMLVPRFGAQWHNRFVQVWFAQEHLRWGPGRVGGLLTGGGSDAYAQVGYRVHVGDEITATAAHGWISAARGQYVAFHRVEGYLGPFILAMAEGVRYDADSPDPLYLVNLIPYSVAERTASKDGAIGSPAERDSLFRSNYMLSADITWMPGRGSAVYGEFLLDDYHPAGGRPQRLGYQLGAMTTWGGARRSYTLQGEYTRIYNFVYSSFYQANFHHAGRSLGYPRGPDLETWDLWAEVHSGLRWSAHVHAFLWNRGEGASDRPWCPDTIEGEAAEDCAVIGVVSARDFLGTVERTVGFLAGPEWNPRDNVSTRLAAGLAAYRNYNHEPGRNPTHALAEVSLKLRW